MNSANGSAATDVTSDGSEYRTMRDGGLVRNYIDDACGVTGASSAVVIVVPGSMSPVASAFR